MDEDYKEITDLLLEQMRANFGELFKAYFDGDPLLIPESSLPALVVTVTDENFNLDATGFDRNGQQITIKLVMNKKDDYGVSDTVDQTEKRLRLLVRGRDANGLLLPNSVVGALRTNYTLSQTLTDQELSIRYGVMPRPDAVFTSEGHVTIVASALQAIPNRT